MIEEKRLNQLEEFEKKLGISFLNKALLNQSLTHSSYAYESLSKEPNHNERLEFLGDAVLKLILSEYLYNKFPTYAEGDLTKIRATVISDQTFSVVSRKLGIGYYLLLGQNEKKTGGSVRKSNLANAFEALVGAIYLDSGIGKARDFTLGVLEPEVHKVSRADFIRDYKSTLQEFVQKKKWPLPAYKVVKETGPKHRRVFWIEVRIKGRPMGVGRGGNKKESEQRAASQALRKLTQEEKSVQKTRDQGLRAIITKVRKKILNNNE